MAMFSGPVFDFAGFVAAYDERRRARGLGWYEFADELWAQSEQLNAELGDHPLCGGAVSRQGPNGKMSCQYALFMLRWLGEPPEAFLTGPGRHTGETNLPAAGPGRRLRLDLAALHAALNAERKIQGLTWASLATDLGCTPARLTNLRSARQADLELAIRITQWLGRPAAHFIGAATW